LHLILHTVGDGIRNITQLVYTARIEKIGKFLLMSDVKVPYEVEIDASSGTIRAIRKPWWRILTSIEKFSRDEIYNEIGPEYR
jgi:hypothetical protein